ncbi:MAG: S41 family peptidase [Chloroflexota bacterium]
MIYSKSRNWVEMQEYSHNYRSKFGQSILYGALIGVICALVFAAGFVFRGIVDVQVAHASSVGNDDYFLLNEVQHLLDQHYLRQQPTPKEREYAAIRGMLATLNDHYTFFVDPPVAQSESDVLAGTYGGVGVQIKRNERGDLILYPYPDSPAIPAGVEVEDILLAINGTPIDSTVQADAVDQMLRGEVKEGSGVTLSIRKQDGKERTVFVPFAVINVPSVVWRKLEDNPDIGYVQILIFTSRTPDELKNALTELKDVKALVLDLRNNSGGLLHESVSVASQFLDGGVVVYERNNQSEDPLNAEAGGVATELPMVVLVNQGTASAAELVAGALRDRQRAILIGQTTYGKGTVQQIFRLSDDSSLHITAAEWLTPNHTHLDGTGLEPNIAVTPDANGRDLELGEASRYLKQKFLGG